MFDKVLYTPLIIMQIVLLVQQITGSIVVFAVHALTHGLVAATKMLSLYTFFYRDSFHKDQKGQNLLKNNNFFKTV